MKDIVLNSEPSYRLLSLYPIAESSVTSLNSSIGDIATATIRTPLTPGFMSLRRRGDIKINGFYDSSGPVCDFIDDFRSGTIVDVIGSVGGLFALLQAMHVLLFGRPLLWGLAGVKAMTPFGLLGTFGSGGFKRRLQKECHATSTEGGADTIKIVKFLRDFVIEFGPADLDPEPHLAAAHRPINPASKVVSLEGDLTENQIPLMQYQPGLLVSQVENGVDHEQLPTNNDGVRDLI
ncbi:unnamed protein product [Rhizoctonia solani]|uniref:Uncharacterized protein n=1 Tax=Rhizoctonia solani TaxID=456999 RepID=A0A8H3CL42_9AGAM|nr:unnamed protein product [Rhizoctonia solani]